MGYYNLTLKDAIETTIKYRLAGCNVYQQDNDAERKIISCQQIIDDYEDCFKYPEFSDLDAFIVIEIDNDPELQDINKDGLFFIE